MNRFIGISAIVSIAIHVVAVSYCLTVPPLTVSAYGVAVFWSAAVVAFVGLSFSSGPSGFNASDGPVIQYYDRGPPDITIKWTETMLST
ncbi:MAG: hypothetical protein AAF664_16820 [Planctomycetota bacterium]